MIIVISYAHVSLIYFAGCAYRRSRVASPEKEMGYFSISSLHFSLLISLSLSLSLVNSMIVLVTLV